MIIIPLIFILILRIITPPNVRFKKIENIYLA